MDDYKEVLVGATELCFFYADLAGFARAYASACDKIGAHSQAEKLRKKAEKHEDTSYMYNKAASIIADIISQNSLDTVTLYPYNIPIN